ncbi:cardiolipin synthase [Paracoccus sp. TK19116]|uniref:Cardiolipin synthase n=1 Tax=Paracoccus albicereus TaxID=2922394 RepID=A0ABT1MSQ0_9RHOB|nr:cardiolipin synthase [Paracoccus albicereus]MCQ0971338.1 cardiolipin synthase [Paracoccus albicereus]
MWGQILFLMHMLAALAIVVRVLMRPRMEPSARLAWIMVVEALPLIGIAAYLLFGEVRMRSAEVQQMSDVRDRLTGLRRPSPQLVKDSPRIARPVIDANLATGGMAAVHGNALALLPEDDGAVDALVAAIDRARDHVHILFYIWLPDHSGGAVAGAIARASARGVRCRVIVDALGSRSFVRSPHWNEMREAGAECVTAFPWGMPLISMIFQRLDLRNHRKIVVIDSTLGFTGSRNCSDMAFAVKPRFAPWVDVFFEVRGPVLRQLQSVFLADWMSYTGEDLGDMLDMVDPVDDPGMIAQVVATGPDRRSGTISDCLATMIHAARERVTITTPYYVPDAPLDAAIRSAARRGVHVTLILPERNDSLTVTAASEGFYYGLLSAGVRLMRFRPGLLHAKIITVDGRMAMIGSANLDRRSFELNYEVNMLVVDESFCAKLDARQHSYVERADPLTLAEVRAWGALRRIRNNALALASPLL